MTCPNAGSECYSILLIQRSSRCFLRIWIWLVQFFCSPTSHLKFLVTFLPSFVYLAGRFLFVCCSLFHSADVCNLNDFFSRVFWIYNFFFRWAHQVTSLFRNIAVNIWWTPFSRFNSTDCEGKNRCAVNCCDGCFAQKNKCFHDCVTFGIELKWCQQIKISIKSDLWAKENKREKQLKVAMSSLQIALT